MRYFVFAVLFFVSMVVQAQGGVSGRVVGGSGDTLVAVTVVLMNADSTVTNGCITDGDGRFSIPDVVPGNYIMRVSMIGYIHWVDNVNIDGAWIDMGSIVLNEDPNLLDEVQVLASLKETDAEKDVLRISRDVMETSYSAVDAIAQMPQFMKEKGELKSDEGKLLIVINNRVATSDELALIPPQEIKRINRYHQPPLQYARYGADVVIEVFTHRASKPYVMAKLYSSEGLLSVGGSEKADLQYADSLHSVVVSYRNYRNRFNRMEADYKFSYFDNGAWNTNHYRQTYGDLATDNHDARVDYSYQDNKYLFAAKMNFSSSRVGNKSITDIAVTDFQEDDSDGEPAFFESRGTGLRERVSDNMNGSLDLYFQHTAKNSNVFALDVTNTLSQSGYQQDVSNEMDVQEMTYEDNTLMGNRFYAITTDARYTGNLWKGRYTVGANHTYRHFTQNHNRNGNSVASDAMTHNAQVYLSYTRSFCEDKLGLYVAADLRDNYYRLTDTVRNSVMPTARYSLNYNITKIFSLMHSGNFMLHDINASELEESEYYNDYRYYQLSNSDLKDYYSYYTDLVPRVSTKDGKLDFQLKLHFIYYNGVVQNLNYMKDRIVYSQRVNAGEMFRGGGEFYLTHKLVKWFSYGISGAYECGKYNIGSVWFDMRSYEEMIRGSFFVGDFTFSFLAMNFISGWYKDAIIHGYNQRNNITPVFDVMVEWNRDAFYLSLEYAHMPMAQYNSTRDGIMDFYAYSEVSRNRDMLHQLCLSFSYRFNTGDLKTRRQQRILRNTEESHLGIKSVL